MVFDDVTKKKKTPTTANQKRWTLMTANRMLRNCQEDIRFCYDVRSGNKIIFRDFTFL